MSTTSHNLDQYMSSLRQILAQGKKRIGILLGAGSPFSINTSNKSDDHTPLIPAIDGLTSHVQDNLNDNEQELLNKIIISFNSTPNIEEILSRVRSISLALQGSTEKLGGYARADYDSLALSICKRIGECVNVVLPNMFTPYNRLAAWIGGTDREHPIEIFTSNYDLLMEEALEKAKIPYFSGFSGMDEPFFDASSVSRNETLPSRWVRVWKLHGSLGWGLNSSNELVAGKGRNANELIYPDHLKYDHIQKLPYTALFDRLRKFLTTPDTLLLSCGFSFSDSHISAVINESLASNPSASVFAFMYRNMSSEIFAMELALKRPNFSVYASDKAIINCIEGRWELGKNEVNKDWLLIQSSFWSIRKGEHDKVFILGDFLHFAKFFALSGAELCQYSSDFHEQSGLVQ